MGQEVGQDSLVGGLVLEAKPTLNPRALFGGSWVIISEVMSPLLWVIGI